MVDHEDQEFLQQFMARAKKREAKLASIDEAPDGDERDAADGEVSYPALSPLETTDETTGNTPSPDNFDETNNATTMTTSHRDDLSITDLRHNNINDSDLNYSSDLSLECEAITNDTTTTITTTANEVYRAEPVVCHSSPHQNVLLQREQQQHHAPSYPTTRQASPRKQGAPPSNQQPNLYNQKINRLQENPAPLHERQPEQKAASSESLPSSTMTNEEQLIKTLRKKIERAEQTKLQLKKAVEVSKIGCKEHIEAARLLQITDHEHLSYTNHVAMLEKGFRRKSESLGSLRLSGIRIKINSRLRDDLADDSVSHHFFCIASCGTDVKATEVINTNDIRKQDLKNYILFEEKLSFVDLPPDFVLKVEVFELIISQQYPKLLSMLTPSKKSRISPDTNFRRIGSLRLTLADREVNFKNLTQWSKHEESKYIDREFKFVMDLKPEQLPHKTGMLHVRCLDSNGRPDWARFWVVLAEGQIKFWKSKQDSMDGKKPNHLIEIKDLCSEFVQKLTPDDDLYRQNSFVIYTFQQVSGGEGDTLFQRIFREDSNFKVVKHQLASENKEDRDAWCMYLDKSMNCFREWNGKKKIYTIHDMREIFSSSY